MKILFVSSLCSKNKYLTICNLRHTPMLDPSQQYFHSLINGFAYNHNCEVECMTELPVSASTIDKVFFKKESDFENSVKYYYLPFINGKLLRYITIYVSATYFILLWIFKNRHEKKYVICDPLKLAITNPVRCFCQLLNIPVFAYITDVPYLTTSIKISQRFIRRFFMNIFEKMSFVDCKKYDGYIFITAQMNDLINKCKKPYIVIDGSVQIDRSINLLQENKDASKRILLYAGGLYERFGIDNLIMAVHKLEISDIELHLYGTGTSVKKIIEMETKDKRIQYKGILSPNQVFKKESTAYLLINPRPTNEVFTQFSFPSKTLEYMASGTAMISTKLPGIGSEYRNYMFWFDDYTIRGLEKGLRLILNKSTDEIRQMGLMAQKFVYENKSNINQGNRIIQFMSNKK